MKSTGASNATDATSKVKKQQKPDGKKGTEEKNRPPPSSDNWLNIRFRENSWPTYPNTMMQLPLAQYVEKRTKLSSNTSKEKYLNNQKIPTKCKETGNGSQR